MPEYTLECEICKKEDRVICSKKTLKKLELRCCHCKSRTQIIKIKKKKDFQKLNEVTNMIENFIKPMGDRVVIQLKNKPDKLPSGLYIPQTSEDPVYEGTVEAVGEGRYLFNNELIPLRVNVGDVVLFKMYGTTPITIKDKKLLIMNEGDILAILTEKETNV